MHLPWPMFICLLLFTKHSPMSVLTTWEITAQMIRLCLHGAMKEKSNFSPLQLKLLMSKLICIINFFMALGHQREILLRSRECKTGSVGYCNQVEGQLKCLGKDLQMVMKKR